MLSQEDGIVVRYSEIVHNPSPLSVVETFLPFVESPYDYFQEMELVYPCFRKWFYERVSFELGFGRELLVLTKSAYSPCLEDSLGFAVLKKTDDERKICLFHISSKERFKGYGRQLFQACLDYLETDTPLMTVSEGRKEEFYGLLNHYQFQLTQELCGYYVENRMEYVFNDYLTSPSIALS
jgi:hypothetical protein